MTGRMTALRALAVGDIFHGRSPNGASLICLVTAVTETTICARRITTQEDLHFDRDSGIELSDVHSRIDCVAPLPSDVYDVFFAMDQKGQVLAEMFRNGVDPGLDRYILTPDEHRALLSIDDHISSNPI